MTDLWSHSPWKVDRRGFKWMSRYVIPRRDDPDETYLDRLRIIQTPWFSVFLHRFHTPDVPIFHDHPWNFVSIVMRGGYTEARPHDVRRRIRWFNRVRASDAHYIESLDGDAVWTLLLVGRRQRNWGYLRPTETGYEWSAWDQDKDHSIRWSEQNHPERSSVA